MSAWAAAFCQSTSLTFPQTVLSEKRLNALFQVLAMAGFAIPGPVTLPQLTVVCALVASVGSWPEGNPEFPPAHGDRASRPSAPHPSWGSREGERVNACEVPGANRQKRVGRDGRACRGGGQAPHSFQLLETRVYISG
ncbi:hypothetical protein TREES_T100008896 [Tupaia chinensis]|uniref:Uncharacterized protein n=1 Tax=Tupaia chinensis TaxID=246437 RepID=L9L1Q5_TUPCH|nr:hypothetical protein TREES_T100008896 [Tupaia chinensis]